MLYGLDVVGGKGGGGGMATENKDQYIASRKGEIFCVVLTEVSNVMVNSEGLILTTEYLTQQAR